MDGALMPQETIKPVTQRAYTDTASLSAALVLATLHRKGSHSPLPLPYAPLPFGSTSRWGRAAASFASVAPKEMGSDALRRWLWRICRLTIPASNLSLRRS